MSLFIIIFALGSIVGGILLLKRSAKKFTLTAEQLEKIKARNELLDKQVVDINCDIAF